MTRDETVKRIMYCRSLNWSHAQIAADLGVSRSMVRNLIYDPTGEKQARRRSRYQGTCETCGASTDGSNGSSKAPRFCANCAADAHRIWTRDKIVAEIRRFAVEHGRPPSATDWRGPRSSGYPSSFTVQSLFGSWANGIEAAGFPKPKVGHYDRTRRHTKQAAA